MDGGWVYGYLDILQGVEKQVSGRQPRRAAFWKAQHIKRYVSIYKSRTTPDHGLRRGFSTPCWSRAFGANARHPFLERV
jgi:hypothetical protein